MVGSDLFCKYKQSILDQEIESERNIKESISFFLVLTSYAQMKVFLPEQITSFLALICISVLN